MDKNIIYGGNYKNNFAFHSFGDFIIKSLKDGGEKAALVKV